MNRLIAPMFASIALCMALAACNRQTPTEPATTAATPAATPATADDPAIAQARATAKDAYIWGFPLVENYKTLYQ